MRARSFCWSNVNLVSNCITTWLITLLFHQIPDNNPDSSKEIQALGELMGEFDDINLFVAGCYRAGAILCYMKMYACSCIYKSVNTITKLKLVWLWFNFAVRKFVRSSEDCQRCICVFWLLFVYLFLGLELSSPQWMYGTLFKEDVS